MNKNNHLVFLDGLRGLAALYVVIFHAKWFLWHSSSTGPCHEKSYPILGKIILYFFTLFNSGHLAVIFFFVLSGFVIHLRYARQLKEFGENSTFNFMDFIKRRARRLYPAFLFSILFTFVLDKVGENMGLLTYTNHTLYSSMNDLNNLHVHDLRTLFGNLLFLMKTYVPVWGTNEPLWSLKYEWWFYMMYPVLWFLSKTSIALATLVLIVLFFLSFLKWTYGLELFRVIFSLILAWWSGVLLADVYCKRLNVSFGQLSFILFLVPFPLMLYLYRIRMITESSVSLDILCSFIFVGLISFCFYLQEKKISLHFLEILKPLGDMSYTLYLTHFPIIFFISGLLMSLNPEHTLPKHCGFVLFGIFATVVFAYFMHFIVEKPFLSSKVIYD